MTNVERIIIIDNDPIVNLLCLHIIKKTHPGMHVLSFTSPEEGLEYIQFEYQQYAVKTILLLDINMPTLSGWEVLEQLEPYKEMIHQYMSIYMFSSSVNSEDKELSRLHPLIEGFIEKPLTAQKLAAITVPERAMA